MEDLRYVGLPFVFAVCSNFMLNSKYNNVGKVKESNVD